MAPAKLILALSLIAAAAPLRAASEERPLTAPPGTPDTRYCMRIYAGTGSLIEQVRCWTRDQWAQRGVDVDKDWPKEGVRVKG
ncbi:hypothetical protein HJG53_17340 [Sphingomonas sp. ID1715]|uniref:hypothetical protein n=1 Tax=Sphingomonas sp. ID1715 TaxID=1656898 RepID=UPI001488B058|nr:hypothetical protein [Sphingomonas sp. ID1715]NNM78654.1 hypothetical protein [Sphingomonas sp. ID1715]